MAGLWYSRRTSPVRFAHPHFAVRQFHNGDATESDQRSNWSRTTALSPIKFLHPKSLVSNFRFWQILLQSLFARPMKNSPGRRRVDRIVIRGTPSIGDELTSDFGGALEDTSIGDCRLFRLLAEN